jgi:hypothetical protein
VKACGHGPVETLAHAVAHVARSDPGQRPGGKVEPGCGSLPCLGAVQALMAPPPADDAPVADVLAGFLGRRF